MISRIVLSIGHGGLKGEKFDPGAIDPKTKAVENTEAAQIVARMAYLLTKEKIPFVLMADFNYVKSINEVNRIYQPGDWAIEIHKDSFSVYNPATMARRCGSYFMHNSAVGKLASEILKAEFIKRGASATSWARPDNFSSHGGLGWNTMTRPLAHIFEMGFIQDNNDEVSDQFYAEIAVAGIKAVISKL